MNQYLLIPFLGGYSHPFSSYFEVHQGYQGFDPLPYVIIYLASLIFFPLACLVLVASSSQMSVSLL